jgi:hypothetical protein
MPASFVLYLAFILLWPLGGVLVATCAVALFIPKYRRYGRAGLIWGIPCGVAVTVPIALVGFEMTRSGLPDLGFFSLLLKMFFAGFAIGALLWYAFHFRSVRGSSAV